MVVMGMTIQVRMVIEEMMAHPQVTLMEEEKLIQIAIRAVMLGVLVEEAMEAARVRAGKEVEMGAGVQTLVEELMEADLVQELLLEAQGPLLANPSTPATQQMLMAVPLGLQMATVATAGMVVMGMTIQVRMVIEEMMAHPQVTLMEEEELIQIAIRAVMLGVLVEEAMEAARVRAGKEVEMGAGVQTLVEELMEADLVQELLLEAQGPLLANPSTP